MSARTSPRDRRSEQAAGFRHLYKRASWQRRRKRQLGEHPLCQWCEAEGKTTPATEVHHAEPHKGDPEKFLGGDLVSLCKPCHDGRAQSIERRGFDTTVGLDGWPICGNHPANRVR